MGEEVKRVYNLRYTLRRSLEEAKKKEAEVKEYANEHKQVQMDLNTGIEPKKEEFSGENETLTLAETEEELTDTQKELVKLKLIVEQQAQLLQSFIQETAENVAAAAEPVQESVPTFTMKFEKENEGFILHQDLKRFITVLEKNPDIFKVEVKITRIEEN